MADYSKSMTDVDAGVFEIVADHDSAKHRSANAAKVGEGSVKETEHYAGQGAV